LTPDRVAPCRKKAKEGEVFLSLRHGPLPDIGILRASVYRVLAEADAG
jgi:hypothetical protein